MTAFLHCGEHDDTDLDDCYECLTARVVEAAVEEYWIHRDAAREHVTKGRQYCQCGICAAVDALIAAREGR